MFVLLYFGSWRWSILHTTLHYGNNAPHTSYTDTGIAMHQQQLKKKNEIVLGELDIEIFFFLMVT